MQETPQQFNYPTYSGRVISRLIDTALFVAIGFIAIKITTNPDNDDYRQQSGQIMSFLFFARWGLYYPLMEANGGSIGKRMMGLKTISTRNYKTGNFIQGYTKLLKFAWPVLLIIPLLLLATLCGKLGMSDKGVNIMYGIGLLPMAYATYLYFAVPGSVDANNQGAHDRASRLMVIKQ